MASPTPTASASNEPDSPRVRLETVPLDELRHVEHRIGRSRADLGKLAGVPYDHHSPPLVAPDGEGGYFVLDGERRVTLAREQGLETIEVLVFEPRDLAHRIQATLSTGATSVSRDTFENADLVDELERINPDLISPRGLERTIGFSHTHWERVNKIRSLPESVRDHGRRKRLRSTEALALAKIPDPEVQERLAEARANKTLPTAAQFNAAIAREIQPDADKRAEARWQKIYPSVCHAYRAAEGSLRALITDQLQALIEEFAPTDEQSAPGIQTASPRRDDPPTTAPPATTTPLTVLRVTRAGDDRELRMVR